MHELVQQWKAKLSAMRGLLDEAGGRAMSDQKFSEYRQLENQCDEIAGRIANATGQPWGPRLSPDLSRQERLEARERYAYPSLPGAGLEGSSRLGIAGRGRGPFNTMGEQLRAIVTAGTPGQSADPRLYETRAATGLGETVLQDGGFLLQSTFSYSLLDAGMQAAQLAPLCRPFPIGQNSNSLDLPTVDESSRATGSRWGGIRLYWRDEAEEKTASKPKFRNLHLEPKKLTGLVYLTDELVQDVAILENFVRRAFTDEFRFVIDDAILRGNGAGEPLGILNAACKVTVSKESSQAADTILFANVNKMWDRLPASSQGTAVWLTNVACQKELRKMFVAVTNVAGTENVGGLPVYMPPGGVSGSPYGTLFGRPVIPIEQASALGDVGDIVLADFNRYILSTRGNLQIASSMHVRFVYDESVLRFVWRVDGQPELASAVTPYKGSDTQSPFIVLEAR